MTTTARRQAPGPPTVIVLPRASLRARLLRDLAAILLITGALLATDVLVTLLWREPVTALIGAVRRTEIDQSFLTVSLNGLDRHALANLSSGQERIAFLARREQRTVHTGAAMGRIDIPRIGLNEEVVQGTDSASLEEGPGHYAGTALPGLGRTVGIAGHRTTYLEPFRHIDALRRGDRIVVTMPYGTFTYRVQRHLIVAPTDIGVVDDVGYERLVLSACNPLFSAAQRYVVFARLAGVVPRGAAVAKPAGRRAPAPTAPARPAQQPPLLHVPPSHQLRPF